MATSDLFGELPSGASITQPETTQDNIGEDNEFIDNFLDAFVNDSEFLQGVSPDEGVQAWHEVDPDLDTPVIGTDESCQPSAVPQRSTIPVHGTETARSPPINTGGSISQWLEQQSQLDTTIDEVQTFLAAPEPQYSSIAHASQMEPPGKAVRYRNTILNGFLDPATPLQVIDQIKYPFEESLRLALEAELRKQDVLTHKRRRVGILPGAKNNRSLNTHNFNPREHYQPLPRTPEAWGPIDFSTNQPTFQYTKYGELIPGQKFTVDQIIDYIAKHPLHGDRLNKRHSKLRLWIQGVPADSRQRYPHRDSMKCRFKDCPNPTNGIPKGMFRVCFDEQSWNDMVPPLDPYHNAGYVHLYCLEKFIDFPSLCKEFNVNADVRALPEETRNKMAINRDHKSMEDIVNNFIQNSTPWSYFQGGRPQGHRWYPMSLCSQLTEEHLKRQGSLLQAVRDKRGGNSIDIHRNNVDLYAEGEGVKSKDRKLGRPRVDKYATTGDKGKGKRKRNAEEGSDAGDEGSGLDNHVLDRELAHPIRYSAKRARRETARRFALHHAATASKRKRSDEGHEADDEHSGPDNYLWFPQDDQPATKRPRQI